MKRYNHIRRMQSTNAFRPGALLAVIAALGLALPFSSAPAVADASCSNVPTVFVRIVGGSTPVAATVGESCAPANAVVSEPCWAVVVDLSGLPSDPTAFPCILGFAPPTVAQALSDSTQEDWSAVLGTVESHLQTQHAMANQAASGLLEAITDQINGRPSPRFANVAPASPECRTAHTQESGGLWSIHVPADSVAALPPAEIDSTAGLGAISLNFADRGYIEEDICYNPGGWSSAYPETRAPDDAWVQSEQSKCNTARAAMVAGLVIVAASSFPPFTPGIVAGVTTFGWGFQSSTEHCGNQADAGWMHCEGGASVTWGGSGGNRYTSTLVDLGLGIVDLSAGSTGDGRTPLAYPVLYNAAGYTAGVESCNAQLEHARAEAYADYLNWGETHSELTSATASVTARVDLVQVNAFNNLRRIADDVFFGGDDDDGGGDNEDTNLLVFSCENSACPTSVALSVNACGAQSITIGQQEVSYDFTGWPGCVSVTLRVGAQTTTIDLPFLRLDGNFGGAVDLTPTHD